jgi:hypothetical protein
MSLSDLNQFFEIVKENKYFSHSTPERYIVVCVLEAGSHLHVGDRITHTAGMVHQNLAFLQLSSEKHK